MIVSCGPCKGTGLILEQTCDLCGGDGKINLTDPAFRCIKIGQLDLLRGQVWSALLTPDGVFRSYLVLECLDPTEYNALTDAQKDGVKVFLMCGLVDLNDGKAGKVRFWNWFGAESTTVASLTALIGE